MLRLHWHVVAFTLRARSPDCIHGAVLYCVACSKTTCARRCQVLAPCCGQVYPCKKCHDQEEDHQLEQQSVQSMVCMACGLRQPSGGVHLTHKS